MKIPSVTTKIPTKKTPNLQSSRYLRSQYLERFEPRYTDDALMKAATTSYTVLKNTLLMASAYSIGLLGYELRTDNYQTLHREGVISYVRPLKTEFDTRREVFDYATERVKGALNRKRPYEHAVYVNNATNEVMAEFRGGEDKVNTAISYVDKMKLKYYGKGATLIHGHPAYSNGVTPPVSYQDFEALCENENLTEIVAMDKDGHVSLLRKSTFFQPPDKPTRDRLFLELVVILFESFERKTPEKYAEVIKAFQEETDTVKRLAIKKVLDYHVLAQDTTDFTNRAIDRYWNENAFKYGLEYFSNYYNN